MDAGSACHEIRRAIHGAGRGCLSTASSLRLLIAVFALGLTVACTPPKARILPPPSLTPSEVARLLAAPLQQINTLQADGIIKMIDRGAPVISDMFLVFDAKQGLRLDIVTPMATPLFSTVVRPDRILLLDFRRNLMVDGPADEQTAFSLLRFAIDPKLLLQITAGGFTHDGPPWQFVPPTNDTERLWSFQSGPWRARIDPESLRLVRLSLAGQSPITVEWSRFLDVDGVSMAHTITIERPTKNQTLVLKLNEVRANQEVDIHLLRPIAPPGWSCSSIDGGD